MIVTPDKRKGSYYFRLSNNNYQKVKTFSKQKQRCVTMRKTDFHMLIEYRGNDDSMVDT